MVLWYPRPMADVTCTDEIIDADVKTIADLPFHIMGRFPKPLAIGRCRGDEVIGLSSKEMLERSAISRLDSARLASRPAIALPSSPKAAPNGCLCDLAILAAAPSRCRSTRRCLRHRRATSFRTQARGSRSSRPACSSKRYRRSGISFRHSAPLWSWIRRGGRRPASPSVLTLDDIERRGHARMTGEWGAAREFRDAARAVSPDDLATIIYTSGTTGEPKGVMLTHTNLVSNMRAAAQALEISQDDVALSFLPLSHAFERMVSFMYLFSGVTIVFAETFDTIARDLVQVRPTVLTGVPRVYEKLHASYPREHGGAPELRSRANVVSNVWRK